MTCIVSLKTENSILLAGDSAGSTDTIIEQYKTRKIFKLTTKNKINMVIGFCGSYRVGDILKYEIEVPVLRKNHLEHDLVNSFIFELRNKIEEEDIEIDWDIMLAVHRKVYIIQPDFSLLEPSQDYTALGNGMEYALGSLFSTKELNPLDRVKIALEAAKTYSPKVDGSTRVIELLSNNEVYEPF